MESARPGGFSENTITIGVKLCATGIADRSVIGLPALLRTGLSTDIEELKRSCAPCWHWRRAVETSSTGLDVCVGLARGLFPPAGARVFKARGEQYWREPLLKFKIPGKPIAKGRPRFDPRTRRAITPKKTARYEAHVSLMAQFAMRAAGLSAPLEGPIALRLVLLHPRPKKVSRSHVLHGCAERAFCAGGGPIPDLSNVVKALEDGLQGVVFSDDRQIVYLEASKCYAGATEETCVEVEAWRVDAWTD